MPSVFATEHNWPRGAGCVGEGSASTALAFEETPVPRLGRRAILAPHQLTAVAASSHATLRPLDCYSAFAQCSQHMAWRIDLTFWLQFDLHFISLFASRNSLQFPKSFFILKKTFYYHIIYIWKLNAKTVLWLFISFRELSVFLFLLL